MSRKFIETKNEQRQLYKHHEEDRLLHERKTACLTEDMMRQSLTNVVSFSFKLFSQQENKNTPDSFSSCCCSLFVTLSVYRQSSDTRSFSVKFKTIIVLCIVSGSGLSASIRTL